MKKQKKFVLNGGDGEEDEQTMKTSVPDILLYSTITIYSIFVIVYIVIATNFTYNLQSEFINAVDSQKLCKNIIYENETIRNKLYLLFKDINTKNKFQQKISAIIAIIIVLWLIISIITIKYSKSYVLLSIITSITLIILCGFYIFKTKLDDLYSISNEYSSKLAILKQPNNIFTTTNLNDVIISSNRQNPTDVSTDTSSNDIETNGPLITLEENIIRRLLHTDSSGSILNLHDAFDKYNQLKTNQNGIDTLIGFVQFIRNSDDYNLLQSAVCGNSICTQGIGYHIKNLQDAEDSKLDTNFKSFIRDIESIDISYTDEVVKTAFITSLTGTLTQTQATDLWNNWAKNQLDIIWPYANKIINNENVTEEWIPTSWTSYNSVGRPITEWMTTDILKGAFVAGVKAYNTKLKSNQDTFIQTVAVYDAGLSKLLKDLDYDDELWNMLKLIQSKDDIQACECLGNPLNLPSQRVKIDTLTVLNYLATLSNGDPRKAFKNKFASLQAYIIILYIVLSYIVFHTLYKVFDRKIIVSIYFGILIFISLILGLMARLA